MLPKQGLFHLHSTYSDGQLAVPEIAALARSRKCSIVSILDHACLSGCIELFNRFGSDVTSVVGYEHTIGDTDIGVFGVNEVMPSCWSIQQIANAVHDRGGSVVYLHPMRGDECHVAELGSWMDSGFVDGWEYRNNLNSKVLSRELFALPSIWGCDLHDENEVVNIPDGGMEIPDFLLNNIETQSRRITPPRYLCQKVQEFEMFFGRCVLEISNLSVRMRLSFDADWGGSDLLDCNGDCVEIAVGTEDGDSFAELHSLTYGTSGMMEETALLTSKGMSKCARGKMVAVTRLIAIDSKNFELNVSLPYRYFSFSVSVKSVASPSMKRFSWPAPVWPPRQMYNLAQI